MRHPPFGRAGIGPYRACSKPPVELEVGDYPWGNGLRRSEFQLKFTDGDSGAAIFDESGRLISMVCGISYEGGNGEAAPMGDPSIRDCNGLYGNHQPKPLSQEHVAGLPLIEK